MASVDIRIDVCDENDNQISHREHAADNELSVCHLLEIHLASTLRSVDCFGVLELLAGIVLESEMAWQDRDDVALAEGDFHRAAFAYLKAIANHRQSYIPEPDA